jgi:hypothetical protein
MLSVKRWKGTLAVKHLALLYSVNSQAHWFCKMAGIRERHFFNDHNDLGQNRILNLLYQSLNYDLLAAATFDKWHLSLVDTPREADLTTIFTHSPQRRLQDGYYAELVPDMVYAGATRLFILNEQYFQDIILDNEPQADAIPPNLIGR